MNILLACDSVYYNNWTINCILSIKKLVPFIKISTVVVNPVNIKEIPDVDYYYDEKEFSNDTSKISYYQSLRFIKCSEIFPNDELVMTIDCDTLLTRPFTQDEFKNLASEIHVQRHQKTDRWMAGLVTYGNNNLFRNRFKEELLSKSVDSWPYGYDQDVLDKLSKEFKFNKLNVGNWMSFGKGRGVFLTLKGNQKVSQKYLRNYDYFKSLHIV